jgi:hypothetical protein
MQGIITAPMLYAMEEFPQLHEVVDRGFDNPANVELVSKSLWITNMLSLIIYTPFANVSHMADEHHTIIHKSHIYLW